MKNLQCLLVAIFCLVATHAYAQPAHDNCADAIAIGEVVDLDFSTLSATDDGATHANDCVSGGSTPDSTYADIWYLYTSTITGQVEFTTCGTADFDTKVYVYDGTAACPPQDGDIVGCSEDGPNCAGSTSQAIFDAVAGSTYYLRLGGYGDGAPGESGTGTFSVQEYIAPMGPDNDFCGDAEVIMLGTDMPFENTGATTDGPEHPDNPCFGFGDNTVQADMWYTFTPTFTGSVEWSVCNTAVFDTRMAVYAPGSACPPLDEDLQECNDDGGGCEGFTSQLIFDVVMNETYLLRLGGFSGETGTGTMNLIEIIPPDPPVNDACENTLGATIQTLAEADNFDLLHEGTTIAGDFDNGPFRFPKCIDNTNGGEFSDVWYTFNTLGNTELIFRLNAETEGASFYLDIWNDCDSIAVNDLVDDCLFVDGEMGATFLQQTISNFPATSTDYHIRVMTRLTSQSPGDFWFQIIGDITTDIEDIAIEQFKLFPNPADKATNLQFQLGKSGKVVVEITNLIGQQVIVKNLGLLNSGSQFIELSTSHLQKGIYLVSLDVDGERVTRKLIVE